MKQDDYGLGWAFFKMCGVSGGAFLPFETDDLVEWVKGFIAAQAEYNYQQQYSSVEAALVAHGVKGKLLTQLLKAAEALSGGEWLRMPSVPLRGKTQSKANLAVV